MSPADYGRALAREHKKTRRLTAEQIERAAVILAAVARERAQEAAA